MPTKITVDTQQIEKLGQEFNAASEVGLRQIVERGEQVLAEEVPKVTRNLEQGISSDVVSSRGLLRGELIITARSGRRGSRQATLHYGRERGGAGKTKSVSLSPQPAYNYAEVVAKGRPEIRPKKKKMLLIPVPEVPAGDSYITSGDQKFILRSRAAATQPNPYDERAAKRLEAEAPQIMDQVLKQFGLLG